MSRRNLAVLLLGLLVSVVCYVNSSSPNARYVAAAYDEIDRSALFEPSDQQLIAGAMRGMVEVLRRRGDEHSTYSDPREAERFMADIRQEFGGVGVRIRLEGEPPRLQLVGPPEPNTPASRAELRAGDYVDAIDGVSTAELIENAATKNAAMEEVLGLMRGPVGVPVKLEMTRGEASEAEPFTVTLVRAEIEVPSVLGDLRTPAGEWRFRLQQDPRIALLRITAFGNKSWEELDRLIPILTEDGVEALVFDLRDNPGGALDVVIDICGLFLAKGQSVVETHGRDSRVLTKFKSSGGPFTSIPLAVLINDQSASAAEIMAACLQDNHRAVVVGERSFGKGTVQRIARMESGRTLLKLTTATYVRPSGVNIHRMPGDSIEADWGVRPDEAFTLEQSNEEKLDWRVARAERDLNVEPSSAGDNQERTSDDWRDAVLDLAVEHLVEQLNPSH